MSVDSLPQVSVSDGVEQLPVAVHGTIRGNQVQRVSFAVSEGQRLVVDVQAKRLGGALQPVVRLYDDQSRQVAACNPLPEILGDARCRSSPH